MYCKAKKLPPFDVVNELLAYNIITGVLTWKVNKSNVKAGTKAGYLKKTGYLYLSINKQDCAAHRVAWLLVTKKDPWPYEVDHINHNKSDNAFKNLRKATIQQNSSNRLKGTNNTSGHKSITYQSHQTSNPYVVCMHQQNKSHYVGSFPTLEMALKARDQKGKELYVTDAIQLLINEKEKFIAHNFQGKYIDCGTMNGYINSSMEIGKL